MKRVIRNKQLRLDLAAARRAHDAVTDPLSLRTLGAYIAELEAQLYHVDGRTPVTAAVG
ncbi:conserved hypothetical protein [Sphingomonas sp. 8AM]|nr:conserved hypothetical protein [Sphingomonas sp. 8AM]